MMVSTTLFDFYNPYKNSYSQQKFQGNPLFRYSASLIKVPKCPELYAVRKYPHLPYTYVAHDLIKGKHITRAGETHITVTCRSLAS